MKITIEYDDQKSALISLKAPFYEAAAEDFRAYLRSKLKHDDKLTQEQHDLLTLVYDTYHEIFNDLL